MTPGHGLTAEERRLAEARARITHWKRWGPYLSARQWGTVREDYSRDGSAWESFPFDHARSRAYRWGEDGIGGVCDRRQYVCLAPAFWNGNDPILKERLFGLTGNEGNHGEDVKELYWYVDATPTSSYLKMLYRYPQRAFPYEELRRESRARTRADFEYEVWDTGVFDGGRFFDVTVEYAKAAPEDLLVRITAANRGPERATLHLLPQLWFRNTWSWGQDVRRPRVRAGGPHPEGALLELKHHVYGERRLLAGGAPELLFTENETNQALLFGGENDSPFTKDGIGDAVVSGRRDTVNPDRVGTKAAALFVLTLGPGESATVRLRLSDRPAAEVTVGAAFEETFAARIAEADAFYRNLQPERLSDELRSVQRQAFAGLLWSRQYYAYDVSRWLKGDLEGPKPPPERRTGRNSGWTHLYNSDVLSMPDSWEYPWYAAWDLAFHTIPLALVDPDFAKEQLILLLREWYMHPNGQLPAYEWNFSDVNPPVHAWAAWRVYKIDRKATGVADRRFLERVFHKLLLNFTWWVNRKDAGGKNVFEGGFLGLDNIGVFDRSAPLPSGVRLEQSDATSWMGMYCLNMLSIALELARNDPAYEDVASKFFEHFVAICRAMNDMGGSGIDLWDEADGFYYDVLQVPGAPPLRLRVRSVVGLIPLFAVETLDSDLVDRLPGFKRRMQWFLDNRPELASHVETRTGPDNRIQRFLSLVDRRKLRRVLAAMLDEEEFLSPHGIRSLSRRHAAEPFELTLGGVRHRVDYEPAESRTEMFGGNSNWRGPVWFPVDFLLVEALQKLHYYLGDSFRVPFPTKGGPERTLDAVARELSRRLIRLFQRDADGKRPCFGGTAFLQDDPHLADLVLFHEYFHGDNGAGIGASHQTGWTALVAKLIQQSGAGADGASEEDSG